MANLQIKGKYIQITGCVAYWAHLTRPTQKYKAEPGVLQYEVDAVVTEDVVEALQDANINKSPSSVLQRNKDITRKAKKLGVDAKNLYPTELEDQYILKLSSLSKWPSGDDKVLKVVYEGKPYSGNIGPGSILDVILYVGKDNGDGHTVNLSQVRVTTLVELEGGEDGFDFDMEGQESSFDDFEEAPAVVEQAPTVVGHGDPFA